MPHRRQEPGHPSPRVEDTMVGSSLMDFDGLSEKAIQAQTHQMLFRALNTGRVVAFVGSGVSRAYNYPDWDEILEHLVWQVHKHVNLPEDHPAMAYLASEAPPREAEDGVAKRTRAAPPPGSKEPEKSQAPRVISEVDRSLLVLDLCDELLASTNHSLQKIAAKLIGDHEESHKTRQSKKTSAPDPLQGLITSLRIRRFLTTNYDHTIESTLSECLHLPAYNSNPGRTQSDPVSLDSLQPFSPVKSLDANPSEYQELIKFALGVPKYNVGVFHCHGSVDHPGDMIVSEKHYQDLYLGDDLAHRNYRDALSLAFGANAVLFVGLGMREADLLRPLRQFVSEAEHHTSHQRPLFVLWGHYENEKLDYEFRRFLYQRYGVKVCFFETQSSKPTSKELCDAIKDVSKRWRRWWLRWQAKVPVRAARFGTPHSSVMIHHHQKHPVTKPTRDQERVLEALNSTNVVVVVGRPGSGKGSLGQNLAMLAAKGRWKKGFFSSVHFSNEFLSTLQSASTFLLGNRDPQPFRSEDPLARFLEALTGPGAIVVIGGIERVLLQAPAEIAQSIRFPDDLSRPPVPVGIPASREIGRFLDALTKHASRESGAKLVVLSSLLPVITDSTGKNVPISPKTGGNSHDRGNAIRYLQLRGMPRESLGGFKAFSGVPNEDLDRFHYAVRGHAYAITVANQVLQDLPPAQRCDWLQQLVSQLTSVGLRQRAEMVVGAALKRLPDSSPASSAACNAVIRTVALCAIPVTAEAIEVMMGCSRARSATSCRYTSDEIQGAIDTLVKFKLLLRIEEVKDQQFTRYTAHTLVRTYILQSLGSMPDVLGEPQSIDLGGFTKEIGDANSHGMEGEEIHYECVDRLLEAVDDESCFSKYPPRELNAEFRRWRALVRAAFGLIRSRWCATTIPRLSGLSAEEGLHQATPHYDSYQKRLAGLLNSMRRVLADELWYDDEVGPDTLKIAETRRGPLYADELSWLYNELGLVSYCKGALPDAYALWRLGQDVSRTAERGFRGHRWCQAELNLAAVQIERARFPRAELHVSNALRAARELQDEDMTARCSLYLGLICHLRGEFDRANSLYMKSLELLRRTQSYRGVSIASRHRGDLLRLQGRTDEAAESIHESIMTAESGAHIDLLWYSRVAEANLHRVHGQSTAGDALEPALVFSKRVGIPKLEADVYKVQAEIALKHGESEMAGRLAVRCLAIGAALGMRLRVTSALVLLGHVYRARGQRSAARAIYESAVRIGSRQGYQSKVEEATRHMLRMKSSA